MQISPKLSVNQIPLDLRKKSPLSGGISSRRRWGSRCWVIGCQRRRVDYALGFVSTTIRCLSLVLRKEDFVEQKKNYYRHGEDAAIADYSLVVGVS